MIPDESSSVTNKGLGIIKGKEECLFLMYIK